MARRDDKAAWERIYQQVDDALDSDATITHTGLTTDPGEADDGVDWGGMPTFLDFSTGVSKMWSAFFPPPPRGGDTTIIEASNPMAGLMPMLPWIAGGGVALYLLTRKKS